MTKRRRDQFERQTVVDAQTIAALTGATEVPPQGIVQTLVEQQLGNEREQGRKRPKRPTEVRRQKRRLSLAFSAANKDAVQRLRDLATRWGMVANNGTPNVSAVAEHLLMPQIEAAERGEIEPPVSISDSDKRSGEMWF